MKDDTYPPKYSEKLDKRRRVTQKQVEEIRRLMVENLSLREISELLHMPYSTVRYWSTNERRQRTSEQVRGYQRAKKIQKEEADGTNL